MSSAFRRVHRSLEGTVTCISALLLVLLSAEANTSTNSQAHALNETAGHVRVMPTFECMSLYWEVVDGSKDKACAVSYRAAGEETWREGQPLWFDEKRNQYRGSVVNLRPDTAYEFRLAVDGSPGAQVKARTWSNYFPIASTVTLAGGTLNEPVRIVEGGSPAGYRPKPDFVRTTEPVMPDVINSQKARLATMMPFASPILTTTLSAPRLIAEPMKPALKIWNTASKSGRRSTKNTWKGKWFKLGKNKLPRGKSCLHKMHLPYTACLKSL